MDVHPPGPAAPRRESPERVEYPFVKSLYCLKDEKASGMVSAIIAFSNRVFGSFGHGFHESDGIFSVLHRSSLPSARSVGGLIFVE